MNDEKVLTVDEFHADKKQLEDSLRNEIEGFERKYKIMVRSVFVESSIVNGEVTVKSIDVTMEF